MPAVPHGRFVAPGFPSTSSDGSFFNPSFQPTDPPVFDQGQQFAKTFLELHRSGRLSGLPAGESHPEASRRSANASDFGVSTEPNPGEVLLRMEAARKRLAPTSTFSEFAMRARADGGVGAGADSSMGEMLVRLGRARERAAAGEGAEAGAFSMHADGEAGVGAGPELGLALLRFAASGDRHSPTDGRKAPSIASPAATPVSNNGRLPNSGTENWPRVPGSYYPETDTSPRQRDDLHFVDRLNKGARYYLGPHLYQGITNVLEALPNVTVPRDVGASIDETGQAIEDRDVFGVVRGIGNIGLSALGVGPVKPNLNVRAPIPQATRRQSAPEGRTSEPQPRNDTGSNRPDNTPSPVGTKVAQEPHYPEARVSKRNRNAPKRRRPRRNNLWVGGELKTTDGWRRADNSPLGNANPYRLDYVKRKHSATIGKHKLDMTLNIDRRKEAIEVTVGFGVDGDDLQTLTKGREPNKNFDRILATVHNKMVDVIEQETGRQRPLIVKFQPATPALEKKYRVFGKLVGEDAFGAKFYVKELPFLMRHLRTAKSRHAPRLAIKKTAPTFVYEFPKDYVFPDQH